MPFDRLSNRVIFKNDDILYDETFNKKGVNFINQYDTAEMSYPSQEDLVHLKYDTRIWKTGDRLYKIAFETYGDSRYWWIIAQFNKKPTDHHFKIGDTFYVPLNLEDVLSTYGY